MTNANNPPNPTSVPRRHRKGFKEAGALMAASLAFMTSLGEKQIASAAQARAGAAEAGRYALAGTQEDTTERLPVKSLKKVEKLPGYEIKVSLERRKLLEDATVKIVRRWKEVDNPLQWELWCTGALVTLPPKPGSNKGGPEQKLVMTAGHCFDDDTGYGDQKGRLLPPPSDAWDFVHDSYYEYGVIDPIIPTNPNDGHEPFAKVGGLSVNGEGDDWALMMLEPAEYAPSAGRNLDTMPAIPYKSAQPMPGQEIALYGWPASSNKPVIGTGRFLGRRYLESWTGKMSRFDVVGINSKQAGEDACFFGASGSVAIGENYVSGPLGVRLNKSYDPRYIVEVVKGVQPATPEYDKRLADYNFWEDGWRENAERQLGVDTSGFDTLCFFGAPDEKLVNKLYNGFGQFPLPKNSSQTAAS